MAFKNSMLIKIKKVDNLLEDQEACGINSLITLIKTLFPRTTLGIDELKSIFDYDKEGIARENYRFNKLNQRLSKDKCVFKIYESKFSGVQDLFGQLSLNVPVPVIMNMSVIERFKSKFDYSSRKFNWGNPDDLFNTDNVHMLLLLGYDDNGEILHFIDPSYQLPYLSETDLNTKRNMLTLNARDFYNYVKSHNLFIEVKYSKKLERKYKQTYSKETQKKLV